ncbi:SDR family oxidoreductase [Hyphobacterium sp. CCMP332]|uniref:SDR family NAD(P)-dependent oxidoreductase n=1 Tax=Hyphobacterium sp. CCMP332 TaxID=2749086 RepID=UPI00164F52F2|nr:SDR family oxidoreductase [Hyphobacterium sp. CCMP332]QNL19996.1 SDR family oxidoreductase [Hyphobacterium sp. CCMP332]
MARKLVLITGASSGIGDAMARQFASRGWDLALVARREDRLRDLAAEMKAKNGVDSLVIPADLSKPGEPERIVGEIEKAGRQIDGLVNNAGAGQPGYFTETDWADQARFLELMVTSYLKLIHLILPGMEERKFGRILNVSSVSALLPVSPGHTRYSGTIYPGAKGLLIKVSQSLKAEMTGKNVHATAVCPGYTWSEFHDVNGARQSVSQLPSYWMLKAEDVAATAYDAVERNKAVSVPGAWYKFMVATMRVLPDPIGEWLIAQQARRAMKRAQTSQAAE